VPSVVRLEHFKDCRGCKAGTSILSAYRDLFRLPRLAFGWIEENRELSLGVSVAGLPTILQDQRPGQMVKRRAKIMEAASDNSERRGWWRIDLVLSR